MAGLHAQIEVHLDQLKGDNVVAKRFPRPLFLNAKGFLFFVFKGFPSGVAHGRCVHTNSYHQVHRSDVSRPYEATMCIHCCRYLRDIGQFLYVAARSSTVHSSTHCNKLREQGGYSKRVRKCSHCWPLPPP